MKPHYLIFFFLCSLGLKAQVVELTGAIFFGNSQLLSYRVTYEIDSKNNVSGYSVCDINGPSETKARIKGAYNPLKKTLHFEETAVINHKSTIPTSDFCLLKVKGKFEKNNNKQMFAGTFSSKAQSNSVICDSGKVVLITTKEAYELATKVAIKMDKIRLPDTLSREINSHLQYLKGVDKVKTVKSGSVTNYTLTTDSITLEIFDDGIEDGDIISILKNNKVLLSDFKTTNEVKTMHFSVDKSEKIIVFTISAVTEGALPQNTVKVILTLGSRKELLIAPLRKGERFQIRLSR